MNVYSIHYISPFPEWSAKDKYILSYFIKSYTAVAVSSSSLLDLNIWNKRKLDKYDFILSKDKCPIIFLDKNNLSSLFSKEVESYLSGCLSVLFFSNPISQKEIEDIQNLNLREISIEDLVCQFQTVSVAVEKVFDDIEEHKTFIYYR